VGTGVDAVPDVDAGLAGCGGEDLDEVPVSAAMSLRLRWRSW
jgi:hypothetical protein